MTQNASGNSRLTPDGGRVQNIDDTARFMYTDSSNSPASTEMVLTISNVTENNSKITTVILTL